MNDSNALRVNMPTADTVRAEGKRFLALWLGAMFLKSESYTYARDQKNPFGKSLYYIAVIGVLIATAGIIGAGLRYATSPAQDGIKNTVLVHLQAMPFYTSLSATGQDSFTQGYERTWNQLGSMFAGYPTDTAGFVLLLLSLLSSPLTLILAWLIFGALVHLIARGWNRETSLVELLGALSLAASPQLLNMLKLIPQGGASDLVVGLWILVCNVFAIRVAYRTSSRRAITATIVAGIGFLIIWLIVVGVGGTVIGLLRRGG